MIGVNAPNSANDARFNAAQRAKLHALRLVQYDAVQFVDADMLPLLPETDAMFASVLDDKELGGFRYRVTAATMKTVLLAHTQLRPRVQVCGWWSFSATARWLVDCTSQLL